MDHLPKTVVSELFFRSGMHRLVSRKYGGNGVILAFHSVVEDPSEYLMGLHSSSETLEKIVVWLQRQGRRIVTLDEAMTSLEDPASEPFAVLTFDDGFRDNLTHALPILEKYSAPFTVFVPTEVITRAHDSWWLRLQELFLDHDIIDFQPLGKKFSCPKVREKKDALKEVLGWVHTDYSRIADARSVLEGYDIQEMHVMEKMYLDHDDLKALSSHKLVTVGGHTTSHPALATLPTDEVENEIVDNKNFLESTIQTSVDHFAYPFGGALSCGDREADIVAGTGFRSAVTTRMGGLFPAHLDMQYSLPRVGIDAHDTRATIFNKISGVYQFVRTRGGSPVVAM